MGLAEHVDPRLRLSLSYRLGSADEEVLRHSLDQDIFLREIPEYSPAATDTIIDVGAHIGTFSCLMARLVPLGRIYAIEPSQETYELLRRNVERNELANVHTARRLLLDRNGSATLFHDLTNGNWGHSAVAVLSDEVESVECETLDGFMERNAILRVDLIKMNCEGAEFPIILHTPRSLLRRIQNMLILHHAYLVPGQPVGRLVAHLRSAGFHVRLANELDGEGWIIASQSPLSRARWIRYRAEKFGRRIGGRLCAIANRLNALRRRLA